ncbi:MAG: hypothetical protein RL562_3178 [Planctomycetota bacterium]
MNTSFSCRVALAAALALAPLAPAQSGFSFDHDQAPKDAIIPAVVPVIFASVAPGDAPLILRTTTLLNNVWFDAIAPFGETAVGICSQIGRRPAAERTDRNRNIAIFHASYHLLNSLYPTERTAWRDLLLGVGLNPDDPSIDPSSPVGIGNIAGRAVVAFREHDGMNQLGDERARHGAGDRYDQGRRYADYTGYFPRNTPYELEHPGRWQPAIVDGGHGIFRVQQFVTPQYQHVAPFSYRDAREFRAPRPTASDPDRREAYRRQVDEVLAASAAMSDRQKMIAELFDDKIASLGFSALFVTVSRNMSLEEFVHYDFLTNLAAFDTGIAIWQEKARHDAVRPFSAIRHVYGNRPVTAWGGPGQGTVRDLPANRWRSYLPVADHPEYPSGSAAFCAAHAESSRLYFDSDVLGWSIEVPQGSSVIEPGHTPQTNITIGWDTWSAFEEECGMSRFWAGVHFPPAVTAGQEIGREIGARAYEFLMGHIRGEPGRGSGGGRRGGGRRSGRGDD